MISVSGVFNVCEGFLPEAGSDLNQLYIYILNQYLIKYQVIIIILKNFLLGVEAIIIWWWGF